MACLLKLPSNNKGVLSITTPEEKFLRKSSAGLELLRATRDQYYLGLHYNWHNHDARPDGLFDFHLAGEGDLKITNGQAITQVPFDACNFSPSAFYPSPATPKHWDILFVARAVFFKGIPDFLSAIRKLYDDGHKLRVLFICPMPPAGESHKNVYYRLRAEYERMFSPEEQDLFNLLVIHDRYPFFFDRDTLAVFYRNSKVFVHSASDERRCRVAAYAWSSGMPVVGMSCVGSIIPENLRREPAFFECSSVIELPAKILKALSMRDQFTDSTPYRSYLSVDLALERFVNDLNAKLPTTLPLAANEFFAHNLDYRLGRHHLTGNDPGPNHVGQELLDFLRLAPTLQAGKTILPLDGDPEQSLAMLHAMPGKKARPSFSHLFRWARK